MPRLVFTCTGKLVNVGHTIHDVLEEGTVGRLQERYVGPDVLVPVVDDDENYVAENR